MKTKLCHGEMTQNRTVDDVLSTVHILSIFLRSFSVFEHEKIEHRVFDLVRSGKLGEVYSKVMFI